MKSMIAPTTLEEIQTWVQDQLTQKHPFVVRGTHSRFSYHSLEHPILSTQNLKSVRFFDPDDMVVGVEAGMRVSELQALLGEKGMVLPINPWYAHSTVGSVVACNDFGPDRLDRGGLRDWIIGLEYINGQGDLVKAGGKVVKNVTGYDVSKMMLGSLGGLGVITAIHFKVLPQRVAPSFLLAVFSNHDWLTCVKAIHEQRIPIDWLEVLSVKQGWLLGVGFSGNPARQTEVELRLQPLLPKDIERQAEANPFTGFSVFPGEARFTGFLEPLTKPWRLTKNSLHLHGVFSTEVLLTQMDFSTLVDLGLSLVIHPIGGDCHFFLKRADKTIQQTVLAELTQHLTHTDGRLTVCRANPKTDLTSLQGFRIPPGYSLMKALKQHLDPNNLFYAPFYHLDEGGT